MEEPQSELQQAALIDDVTPAASVFLADKREAVLLQHGGTLTRFEYDRAVVMDLDAFLRVEVPRLKKQTNELTVIRTDNRLLLIQGDQVVKYELNNISDVGLHAFSAHLKSNEDDVFVCEVQYPLVCRKVDSTQKTIIVYIEAPKFIYRSDSVYQGYSTPVQLPPIWLRVSMTHVNVPVSAGVVAVLENSYLRKDTKLYHIMLPNISKDGNVCLGYSNAAFGQATRDEITEGGAVQSIYERIFNSNWNFDMLDDIQLHRAIEDAYLNVVPQTPELQAEVARLGVSSAINRRTATFKYTKLLNVPGGWRHVRYPSAACSTLRFMGLGN